MFSEIEPVFRSLQARFAENYSCPSDLLVDSSSHASSSPYSAKHTATSSTSHYRDKQAASRYARCPVTQDSELEGEGSEAIEEEIYGPTSTVGARSVREAAQAEEIYGAPSTLGGRSPRQSDGMAEDIYGSCSIGISEDIYGDVVPAMMAAQASMAAPAPAPSAALSMLQARANSSPTPRGRRVSFCSSAIANAPAPAEVEETTAQTRAAQVAATISATSLPASPPAPAASPLRTSESLDPNPSATEMRPRTTSMAKRERPVRRPLSISSDIPPEEAHCGLVSEATPDKPVHEKTWLMKTRNKLAVSDAVDLSGYHLQNVPEANLAAMEDSSPKYVSSLAFYRNISLQWLIF
jgi:hypothetical protein